ncbi:hypothetical protein [Nocardioides yefusunii]|uniref:Uncharacterized protein n=1 Tax=Nocardioides yefusunii TaxID=2500546 RepID=A0ABW1QYH0_9ACTN|nr:hypothetical protein [Nocardioides yefusunii]
MTAPTPDQAHKYVGRADYTLAEVTTVLAAERAAQARRCRVPTEGEWPADLVEALLRRTLAALAMRANPLGVAVSVTDFGVSTDRVGGLDPVVRRLEAPHVKLVLG